MIKSAVQSGIANTQKYRNMNGSYVASSDYKLDEVILSSNTPSVTLDVSSFIGSYKNLQIRISAASTSTDGSGWRWVRLQGSFNGDTTNSNYAIHQLAGAGNTLSSYYETSSRKGFGIATRNSEPAFAASIIDLLDFSNTSKNKVARSLYGMTGSNTTADSTAGMLSELWINTSAITSINITTEDGSNFKTGSRFSLYGSN